MKQAAASLGFSACGISRAERVSDSARQFMERYIAEGRNAEMHYLERNADMRFDPRLLVEGTRSIVSVALNYYPRHKMDAGKYTFSYYAYGQDYHVVVRSRLLELFRRLAARSEAEGGKLSGRAFCDTAPVAERYWAWRAGLGFIGKNSLIIIPRKGSFFFLGELFLSDEADAYDQPIENMCGACRKCMDACPGGAISEPFSVDARRCLSYLTIENRGALPEGTSSKMDNCIYGCDRCQSACPHNRFAEPTGIPELQPKPELMNMTPADWQRLTPEQYCKLFRDSAVKRAKYSGLMRNINAVKSREEGSGEEQGSKRAEK